MRTFFKQKSDVTLEEFKSGFILRTNYLQRGRYAGTPSGSEVTCSLVAGLQVSS